jgi:ABC-type sugar transport system permease subunit
MQSNSKQHTIRRIPSRTQTAEGLLFILPYAILWVLFLFGPILYGFYISLHKWDPLAGSTFIGFKNYLDLFDDARFWNSFWVTWKYSLWVIPGIIAFGLGSALILQAGRFPGSAIFEGVLFFPYLLNVSIISIVWKLMLDPDVGVISQALRGLGIGVSALLNDEFWVIPMVALTTIWWLMGYRMLLFRASLASIPNEFYEASAK